MKSGSSNSYSKSYMRNTRIWKIYRSQNQLLGNKYKKLDGIYYNFLLYNLNFDESGSFIYNYVRPDIDDNNSSQYYVSARSGTDSYSNYIDSNSQTVELQLCEINQNKAEQDGSCRSNIIDLF